MPAPTPASPPCATNWIFKRSTMNPIEYADAPAAVRAVYEDIKKTRNVPDVNNFWKYLARDPATLKRTWESIKEIMAPGALDPLTKDCLLYTSDAADDLTRVDLGGRRIITKKKTKEQTVKRP